MASIKDVVVPDLGNVADAEIIEIPVKVGDSIKKEDTLITLESEKASMDIPAPVAGIIKEIAVKVGNKVFTGALILRVETTDAQPENVKASNKPEPQKTVPAQTGAAAPTKTTTVEVSSATKDVEEKDEGDIHAGPGVRRLAREFGIDLNKIKASGPKERILKEDVQAYVKAELNRSGSGGAVGFPSAPVIDFTQFGPVENKPLSRIKRFTAVNLHRNWVLVPHVTQFEEADITELEAFRKSQQQLITDLGIKLTPLIFIMKAVVAALKAYPNFNASLDPSGEQLIIKKYFNLGIAVDTPEGLVVPVIRDIDKKGLLELAKELQTVSAKARAKQLTPNDMQGSSFTISSLGGIGGTAFTPIVNLPDVAILGVSKASMKPVYQGAQFVPRLMLPLSLSYDHRVIDGAEGARFVVELASSLADIRRWLL